MGTVGWIRWALPGTERQKCSFVRQMWQCREGVSLLSPPEHWTRFAGLGKILRRTNSSISVALRIKNIQCVACCSWSTGDNYHYGAFFVCGILNIFKNVLKYLAVDWEGCLVFVHFDSNVEWSISNSCRPSRLVNPEYHLSRAIWSKPEKRCCWNFSELLLRLYLLSGSYEVWQKALVLAARHHVLAKILDKLFYKSRIISFIAWANWIILIDLSNIPIEQ